MVDTNVFIALERRAQLMEQGKLIGSHDLIIAATALHHGLTLLTDNVAEFRGVPALNVVEFTS